MHIAVNLKKTLILFKTICRYYPNPTRTYIQNIKLIILIFFIKICIQYDVFAKSRMATAGINGLGRLTIPIRENKKYILCRVILFLSM